MIQIVLQLNPICFTEAVVKLAHAPDQLSWA